MDTEHMKRVKKMLAYARDLAGLHNELVAQLERELTPTPAAHYNGEPCNLPVWYLSDKPLPKGMRLVYTGEFRLIHPNHPEWGEFADYRNRPVATFGWCETPKWILREEPTAPVHKKGDVCDAPRGKSVPEEGVFVFRDGHMNIAKAGDFALGWNNMGKPVIFRAFSNTKTPKYILTHVVPKYKKGQWVTKIDTKNVFQVTTAFFEDSMFWYNIGKGLITVVVGEYTLRPAVPSDWAKEFDGHKFYLVETKEGKEWHLHCITNGNVDIVRIVYPPYVAVYKAAGILIVPQEVCDGTQ